MNFQSIIDQIKIVQFFCKNHYMVKIPVQKIKYDNKYVITSSINLLNKNKIIFEKNDTLLTALKYQDLNPLILIFADETTPGGTTISNCQEEVLFRRTTLFAHLQTKWYPIKDDELLLVKDVGILNCENNSIGVTSELDFIALPCVKSYVGRLQNPDLYDILKNKIRLIFQTCVKYNYKTVILGALGCGAFSCNAKEVAIVFKEVVEEFENHDLCIIYSILGGSYSIFSDILS
jgi:uncharacterized protein (TIGR02452 family)